MAKNTYQHFLTCIQRYKAACFILFIAAFHFTNNYIILVKRDLANLTVNIIESRSYAVSIEYFYSIKESLYTGALPNLFISSRYAPDGPLYSLATVPFYFLFGCSKSVAILSNTLFFLVLLASVYFIGKRLGNNNVGLVACFLVSLMPGVFGYFQVYHISVLLMALSALAVAFLLYSDSFSRRSYSCLFGASFGLVCLTKFSGGVYLIGPLIYACYKAFAAAKHSTSRLSTPRLINLSLACISCIVLLLPWYIPQGARTLHAYSGSYNSNNMLNWSAHANFKYIYFLAHAQLLPVFFALFVICLVLFLFLRIPGKGLILLWLVVPYVFFSLFWPAKESYFTVPCLPAIALIISITVEKGIPHTLSKRLFITLVVFFALIQYFVLCYKGEAPFLKDPFLSRMRISSVQKNNFQRVSGAVYATVSALQKPQTDVLLLSLSRNGSAIGASLAELAALERRTMQTTNLLGSLAAGGVTLRSRGVSEKFFLKQDFIIYTTDYHERLERRRPPYPMSVAREIAQAMALFESCKDKFELVQEIPAADDGNVLIYKRRN